MNQKPILTFSLKKTSLRKLIETSLKPFSDQLQDKDIDLQIKIEESLPEIEVDFEKSVWVLINLIGNALRYSSKWGKINIHAQKEDEFVKISVSDNGRGIEKNILKRLFLPFTQEDEDGPGLGIGLFISKEMIEAQGGKISAKSVVGEGSQFSVFFKV